MTNKSRLTAVDAIAAALHEALCVPDAKPHAVWSGGHLHADRRLAVNVVDRLHAAGWHLRQGIEAGTLMPKDFLAAP